MQEVNSYIKPKVHGKLKMTQITTIYKTSISALFKWTRAYPELPAGQGDDPDDTDGGAADGQGGQEPDQHVHGGQRQDGEGQPHPDQDPQ